MSGSVYNTDNSDDGDFEENQSSLSRSNQSNENIDELQESDEKDDSSNITDRPENRSDNEEEPIPTNFLKLPRLQKRLKNLSKTSPSGSMSFTHVNLSRLSLTNLEILKKFPHLRYVDVSSNNMKDLCALASLESIVVLKATDNLFTDIDWLPSFPFLQELHLARNKIKHLPNKLSLPMLLKLNLSENRLCNALSINCLGKLKILEIKGNGLDSLNTLTLPPNLQELYLDGNQFANLENFPNKLRFLRRLHLRGNKLQDISGLSFDSMPSLQYLNLRSNLLSDFNQLSKFTDVSPNLKVIIISENPLCEGEDYRVSAISQLGLQTCQLLHRLDKEKLSAEELGLLKLKAQEAALDEPGNTVREDKEDSEEG